MQYLKISSAVLVSLLLLAGCGGNSSEVSSGGGEESSTATTQKACTGEDLKGNWRITAMVGPLTETDVVAFDGSESPGSNIIEVTRDGITLSGTIDPSCNSASGTATDGNLSGTFSAVKIS